MVSTDQIVQKVIDKLQADVDLGTTDLKDVKKIYFGRRKSLAIDYPALVVWLENELPNPNPQADSSRILYQDLVAIAILERSNDEDSGEKNSLKKAARVEVVLRVSKTLDGLVADEPIPAIPKNPLPVDTGDFAFTEVSMFVTYRRWESY